MCQSCESRFYDLARDPIVCPLCGAEYAVVNEPVVAAETRAASTASKTGWRSRGPQRPKPVMPVYAPEENAEEVEAADDLQEESLDSAPDDSLVLEQEPDEGSDVADLGVGGLDPKET